MGGRGRHHVPRPDSQAILDTALSRADGGAQQRFEHEVVLVGRQLDGHQHLASVASLLYDLTRDGMTATPFEVDAMRRAIALSALGLATTSPNPPVGCVILDPAERIVGEGYHERKGENHAEVNALAAAGERAVGATAVVSLEPCNHHGRTPPCHQALIDAGVARVLVALVDPTSRGEGATARLRDAGVEVEVGVLADEALLVLGPWLAALRTGRPRVTWAYQVGPDGPRALPDDLLIHHSLRCGVDAVVFDDGHLEEGVPGTHGQQTFVLTDSAAAEPDATLSSLYVGGARSVLLHGGLALAQPFLDHAFVDDLRLVFSTDGASAVPTAPDLLLLPPAFRIQRVRKLVDAVLVDAGVDRHPG